LHGLGRLVDERLGLLEPEAGRRADDLDHLDLLVAGTGQEHVEGGLLLGLGATAVGARPGRRRWRRGGDSGRRDAERLLERLDPLGQLEHRDALELVDPLLRGGHHSSLVASDDSASGADSVSVSSGDSGAAASASEAFASAICCNCTATPAISAFNVRTRPDNGAAIVPTSCPCRISREGSRAIERTSSPLSAAPFIRPPLNSSVPSARPASLRARAATAASPDTNASAVGPSSIDLSASAPA